MNNEECQILAEGNGNACAVVIQKRRKERTLPQIPLTVDNVTKLKYLLYLCGEF
jgi:hypothetical protein